MSETHTMRRGLTTIVGIMALLAALLYAPLPVAVAQPPVGSATVTPLQVTGPPGERLNLVIMGDGYTAAEEDKFFEDVDRNLNVQWSVEPFRSYRNYFNVYAMFIVSGESGIRCDPDEAGGPKNAKNTPLRLWYDVGCSDPLARGITYGPAPLGSPAGTPNGNTQRNSYLNTYMGPIFGVATGVQNLQNVQTLAIANTFTYGGIGGVHATTSGGSPQGPLVSLHELGHSLGNLQDEYPYSSRPTPGGAHPSTEPSSIHHSRLTGDEMVAQGAKWWRWLGEESESGGIIGARGVEGAEYESGLYRSSNIWRPSEHSMMRWIGFYFDQIGREHMVGRITGRRNANAMQLNHLPTGEVGSSDVVWVETMHPKFHELDVTWRINGNVVPGTNNTRNLELGNQTVAAGDVVQVEVRDSIDWVRDPGLANGPRMVQTRQWTVGTPIAPSSPAPEFTASTPTNLGVAADEVVYVETTHPSDRVHTVTWRIDGEVVPGTNNSRNLNLGELGLGSDNYTVSATVTDPANPAAPGQTLEWNADRVYPEAPAELSDPATTVAGQPDHGIYFGEFDMWLDPNDDQPGFVVGEFRLNGDGWFNYFGFPEAPFGSPFTFSHSGKNVKALTYGNLGSGGLSKATFEQSYPDFEPGYGTHTVEHRAIDVVGNIGDAGEFTATVLPGGSPECTTTVTGRQSRGVNAASGVTCVVDADVAGGLSVAPGASIVVIDSTIRGQVDLSGASLVHVLGSTFKGRAAVSGTTSDVTIAGSEFNGGLTLTDNTLSGSTAAEYGVALVGNNLRGSVACSGNTPGVTNFGAPNRTSGPMTGQCADL